MTGSGTEGDPFIIGDVDDLQAMNDDLSAYYELGNDIDASATSTWNSGAGFVPIGTSGSPFTGNFDGKDYTISDLHISRSSTDNVGLFGYVTSSLAITNVLLTNPIISGADAVGAMVGWYAGTNLMFQFCAVDGGTIIGKSRVGGFGGLLGKSSKCYTKTAVIATGGSTNKQAGGFCSTVVSNLQDCYSRSSVQGASGYIIGGLATSLTASGSLDNCYSTGAVSSPFGSEYGLIKDNFSSNIRDSFWDTQTSGVGASEANQGGTGKTTTLMKTQSTFTDADWNFSTIWALATDKNGGYPYLQDLVNFIDPPDVPAVGVPTVTTQECTDTIAEKTTGHGTITDKGDSDITQHGHTWSTSPNPIILDNPTSEGTAPNLGQFQSAITGLLPNTTYYVRAYATNSQGTGYGSDVTIGSGSTIGKRYWWVERDEFHWWSEWGVEQKVKGTSIPNDQDILAHLGL